MSVMIDALRKSEKLGVEEISFSIKGGMVSLFVMGANQTGIHVFVENSDLECINAFALWVDRCLKYQSVCGRSKLKLCLNYDDGLPVILTKHENAMQRFQFYDESFYHALNTIKMKREEYGRGA